jgi:BASS family bile acid:Na+ symporter
VILAAAGAMLVPDLARALRPTVLPALALMVFGVGVTLTPADLRPVGRRPLTLIVALAVQWTVMPAAGIALAHLTDDATVARGIEITAFAPAEITSVLMVILAGGTVALGAALMACSLLTGAVLSPLWVRGVLGPAARVSAGGLIVDLLLGVVLPFVAGLALSTSRRIRAGTGPALSERGVDLSAVAVVYVVFAGTGDARDIVTAADRLVVTALLCLALLAVGATAGRLAAVLVRAGRRDGAALLYPVAMREFGLATSVATLVAPPSAAVAALYGIILMIVTPPFASRTRTASNARQLPVDHHRAHRRRRYLFADGGFAGRFVEWAVSIMETTVEFIRKRSR